MSNISLFDKANDSLEEFIKPIIQKGAGMNATEIAALNDAICAMKNIKKIKSLEKQIDFMDNFDTEYGNSYTRGRSPITGRYVSRDSAPYAEGYSSRRFYDGEHHNGYSGHSIKDRMIDQLEKMYDTAQTEHERQTVNDWIRRLESGN